VPDWLRFPLTLAVIAALAGGGLALVEVATRERVKVNEGRKLEAAFGEIPGCAGSRPLEVADELAAGYGEDARAFELLGEDGGLVGYAAQVACTDPPCYNGTKPIVLVVALDAELREVTVVRTTANNETPGLGTRVSARKPSRAVFGEQPDPDAPDCPFLDQFRGQPVEGLGYRPDGELDAISGATVSSEAVLGGIRKAAGLLGAVRSGAPPRP
jgi:Na+-translocating ferredoxin:NAD+ oxidoreductase RnfG subunit